MYTKTHSVLHLDLPLRKGILTSILQPRDLTVIKIPHLQKHGEHFWMSGPHQCTPPRAYVCENQMPSCIDITYILNVSGELKDDTNK